MGVFVQVGIFKNVNKDRVREAILKLESQNTLTNIVEDDCTYKIVDEDVVVLLNDEAVIEENDVLTLSTTVNSEVLSLFIYDGDLWGYYLADKNNIVDKHSCNPEYFEDISEEESKSLLGSSIKISGFSGVNVEEIEKYLVHWTDDLIENEELAYEDDEFTYGDGWQMVDFMRKIGFSYEF